MALLTADDVLNKKFQATKFREGYDQDEVDDFLDEVVNTLRAYTAENDDLRAKLAAAERRIAELSRAAENRPPEPRPAPQQPEPQMEQPRHEPPRQEPPRQEPGRPFPHDPSRPGLERLTEPESATGMLHLAQRLHDDYVRSGQEEGERIVNEAKVQAARIVREAEENAARTMSQLEQERGLLERKIDELRVFERDYRTRLKSYLENLLNDLETRTSAVQQRGGDAGLPLRG